MSDSFDEYIRDERESRGEPTECEAHEGNLKAQDAMRWEEGQRLAQLTAIQSSRSQVFPMDIYETWSVVKPRGFIAWFLGSSVPQQYEAQRRPVGRGWCIARMRTQGVTERYTVTGYDHLFLLPDGRM